MALTISWSPEAKADYEANIDYLLEEWSLAETEEFINNANKVIHIISLMPELFPASDYKNIRKAVICKQISLLYSYNKNGGILLRFWNNSQNPEKLVF